MILAVSGTPGTGKTTLAKRICTKTGALYVNVSDLLEKKIITSGYDRSRKCRIVDIDVLDRYIHTLSKKHDRIVVDSHVSHVLACASRVLICGCDITILNRRLEKRGYSLKKIRENLDAQIFDICYNESIEMGKKTERIDCTKSVTDATLRRRLLLLGLSLSSL